MRGGGVRLAVPAVNMTVGQLRAALSMAPDDVDVLLQIGADRDGDIERVGTIACVRIEQYGDTVSVRVVEYRVPKRDAF